MKRREFVEMVGVGSFISALPATVSSCAQQTAETAPPSTPTSPIAATPRTDGFEVAGTVADLDKTGQLLNEKMSLGKALIVRNGDQLVAVDPTCTHQGCVVAWNADKSFLCPCHDAKYSPDGKVTGGPAPQPLALYTAKIEGDLVLVKKG